MKRTAFLSLLIGLLLPLCLYGQQSSAMTIERIHLEGMKRTKVDYLRQFLEMKSPLPYTGDSLILADVQRLKNIPGIATASFRLDTLTAQSLALYFTVEEKRTFLPIVNFGGIQGNFWFQLGFTDINWMGRGQQLEAFYQNIDRRHNGQIFYRVPYYKKTQWGYSLSLRKYSSVEPLFFSEGTVMYNYDNYSFALSAIRNLGIQKQLELGATLFREDYAQSAEQPLTNPPGPRALSQNKWLGKLGYSQNRLNYDYFYLRRSAWMVLYQTVLNFDDSSWFHTFNMEYRHFWRPFTKSNIALRLRLGLSSNIDSPFAPFVVDSNVNLRGVGNRIDRGTAQAVLNLEYRQTVYDRRQWAAQVLVFSDAGTWRNPGGTLSDLWNPELFRHFVGGGFRIIYKKVHRATLRVDYGVDVFNPVQRGFVFGVGQYF